IDLGFPVMRAPDGRKFKPLFAALIQDLDNRVNVNAHGNVLSDIIQRSTTWCISHQGWSPGEVCLDRVIGAANIGNYEVQGIFVGNNGVAGRYDRNVWGAPTLDDKFCPGGHFYSGTDIDCWNQNERNALVLPTGATGCMFPWHNEAYSHSWGPVNYDKG